MRSRRSEMVKFRKENTILYSRPTPAEYNLDRVKGTAKCDEAGPGQAPDVFSQPVGCEAGKAKRNTGDNGLVLRLEAPTDAEDLLVQQGRDDIQHHNKGNSDYQNVEFNSAVGAAQGVSGSFFRTVKVHA